MVQELTAESALQTNETTPLTTPTERFKSINRLLPGLALTIVMSGVALLVQWAEEAVLGQGHAVIESLVVAIVLGMVWRTLRGLPSRAEAGVHFAAKPVRSSDLTARRIR